MRQLACCIAAIAGLITGTQTYAAQGRSKGIADVSSTGSFVYSMPLWTPPGPRGIQPEISLGYDSNASNGFLGVGWTIQGLSSIERCPRTAPQDGPGPGGIAFSNLDRFCIDGNRLRLTGGTYGADGSTYQTQLATFAKFTAYLSAGSGPQYFKVQGNDGLTYEYGNSTDSRVLAGFQSSVLRWMLNKVSDRSGNNYKITYNMASGFAVPATISWTPVSSGSSSYQYTMNFAYSTKALALDAISGSVGGQVVSNLNRLDSISIKSLGTTVRKYTLLYQSSSTTRRSILTQVNDCADDAGTNCFSPTTFNYQAWQLGTSGTATSAASGTSSTLLKGQYDFNGDGRSDLAYQNGGVWWVSFATSSGFAAFLNTGVPTNGAIYIDRLTSAAQDGFLTPGSGGLWYYSWNGSSFSGVATGTANPGAIAPRTALADTDGDGRPDLVWTDNNSVYIKLNTTPAGSTTPTFSSTQTIAATLGGYDPQPGHGVYVISGLYSRSGSGLRRFDRNYDGRQDLYATVLFTWNQSSQTSMLLGNGSTFTLGAASYGVSLPWDINFNSDQCSDIVGGANVYVSACNGNTSATLPFSSGAAPVGVIDWDGDGRSDVLVKNGTTLGVYLSTGTGLSPLVATSIPYSSTSAYFVLDQNGDGLDDLAVVSGSSPFGVSFYAHAALGSVAPSAGTATQPDLMVSVTDGYGVNFSPGYVTHRQSNYSSGAAPTAPLREYSSYQPALNIVGVLRSSDGVGGTFTRTYSYEGARVDSTHSDDFVGFERRSEVDSRTGFVRQISYKLAYPFTGQISQNDLFQANGTTLISHATFDNQSFTLDSTNYNQRYFTYVAGSVTERREFGGGKNGQLITTVTDSTTYTDFTYGNSATTTRVIADNDLGSPTYGNSWTTSVAYSYSPDAGNWCVNSPYRMVVTKSSTAGATVSHTTDEAIDYAKCRPTQIVNEPQSTKYKVTTDVQYDDDAGVTDPDFGNVTKITVTGTKTVNNVSSNMTPRVSTSTWNATGQFVATIKNAQNEQLTFAYDLNYGLRTSEKDANNLETQFFYDAFGRPMRTVNPDQTSTTFTIVDCASIPYCPGFVRTSLAQWVRDRGGNRINSFTTYLDSFDRPVQQFSRTLTGASSGINFEYDVLGRLKRTSSPCAGSCATLFWTTTTYDSLGRPTQVDRQLGSGTGNATTKVAYAGRSVTRTDANLHDSVVVTDPNGWVRRISDASGYAIDFGYDADGNKVSVIDNQSNTLWSGSYEYGEAAFNTAMTDSDLGNWSYTYNSLGELVSWKDAKQQSFSAEYDLLSRMTSRAEPDLVSTWTWGTGTVNGVAQPNVGSLQRTTAQGAAGGNYAEDYTYDSLGRLKTQSITADNTYAYDYSYNDDPSTGTGLLDTMTYPVSTNSYRFKLKYVYQNGIVQQLQDANTGIAFWTANAANSAGQYTQESLRNGVVTNRVYDPVTGEVSSIQSGIGGGSALQNDSYLFDGVGNLTQRQNGNLLLSENAYYDSVNRLEHTTLSSNGGAATTNYDVDYDLAGRVTRWQLDGASSNNRDFTTQDSHCTSYPNSQMHAVRKNVQNIWSAYFCYDANGNSVSSGVNGTPSQGTTWTSFNKTQSIAGASQFLYDQDHQRWKQSATYSGATEDTRYIGPMMEEVTTSSGVAYRHYIPAGNSTIVYTRRSAGGDSTYYVLKDNLASSTVVTDSGGGLIANASFSSLGTFRRGTTTWTGVTTAAEYNAISAVTRRGFTGQEMLDNVSKVDMNGRTMGGLDFMSPDPFISDPANTQNYNRYAYVYNNPLSNVDPTGFVTMPDPGSQDFMDTILVQGHHWSDGFCGSLCPDQFEWTFGHFGPGNFPGSAPTPQPQMTDQALDQIVVTAFKKKTLAGEKLKFNLPDPVEQLWIVLNDGTVTYIPTTATKKKDSCGNPVGANEPDGTVPMPATNDIAALIHTHQDQSWSAGWPASGDWQSAKNFPVYGVYSHGAWVIRKGAAPASAPANVAGQKPSPPSGIKKAKPGAAPCTVK